MSREVAVRYVEGTDPAEQESLMAKMVADGWDVVGWGQVTGIISSASDGKEFAGTTGFMLYFGRDKTAAMAAELAVEDAKAATVSAALPTLNRAQRRRLGAR